MQKSHKKIPPYQLVGGIFQLYIFVISSVHLTGDTPKSDAMIPFISHNESMWEFFEPELSRRLSMMETDDTYAARVRSALMELLPSGECVLDDVAKKLGYSKRTIQRKLQEEDTNF